MLRAFMTERGKEYDYEKEVLKRMQQLRSRAPPSAPSKGRALAWNTDFAPFIGLFQYHFQFMRVGLTTMQRTRKKKDA